MCLSTTVSFLNSLSVILLRNGSSFIFFISQYLNLLHQKLLFCLLLLLLDSTCFPRYCSLNLIAHPAILSLPNVLLLARTFGTSLTVIHLSLPILRRLLPSRTPLALRTLFLQHGHRINLPVLAPSLPRLLLSISVLICCSLLSDTSSPRPPAHRRLLQNRPRSLPLLRLLLAAGSSPAHGAFGRGVEGIAADADGGVAVAGCVVVFVNGCKSDGWNASC